MSSEAKYDINSSQAEKDDLDKKYNVALTKALTAFYKKLKITQPGFYDHMRFDPYVKKIVEKRGAGTGVMDNIQTAILSFECKVRTRLFLHHRQGAKINFRFCMHTC